METKNLIINGNELFDIKGFEGLYKINKQGEVYSIKPLTKNTIIINNQLYIKTKLVKRRTTKTRAGLGIGLYDPISKKYKYKYIHRLLAELFIPNISKHRHVIHIDNNIFNNELSNLKWGIVDYNYSKKGDTIKITDVANNSNMIFNSINDVSKYFNVSRETIRKYINGRNYLNRYKIEKVQ